MNARKILCLMAAVLMLSGCSKGVDGSSKAAESSGKADSSVSDYDNTTTEPETDKPEFDLNDSVIGFSQESGFYDSGFSLELTANEGEKIYYTTDGTDPRTSATREEYTAPIEIKDRSNDPNVVSAVPTEMISGNFNEFSFGEGDFWCNKKAPSDNAVDKCTVIRASSEKSDGSVSQSFSGSFYIGSAEEHIKGLKESCEAAGHDLAVMNITMDYADLFDSKIGIYVKGDIFSKALEDYKASGESIENETARQLDANYKQRGKEWERDCHIELNEISAEGNVTKITEALEQHQMRLMKDSAVLDKMYEQNLAYFKELSMYILAGKKKLREVREGKLNELHQKAAASGLPEDAQAANDLESKCDRFEKKLHDLELTRTISMQTAPQIRMIQNNDTMMIEKIQTTIVNTIPLWKSQMVLALGLAHSEQAVKAQREVSNMTNELLRKNAERLKMSTIETARESERGVVDMETLRQTNQSLIQTLDEVVKIQDEGRQKRREAEAEIGRLEGELKQKLLEINK